MLIDGLSETPAINLHFLFLTVSLGMHSDCMNTICRKVSIDCFKVLNVHVA